MKDKFHSRNPGRLAWYSNSVCQKVSVIISTYIGTHRDFIG